jgi:hypothetical protein
MKSAGLIACVGLLSTTQNWQFAAALHITRDAGFSSGLQVGCCWLVPCHKRLLLSCGLQCVNRPIQIWNFTVLFPVANLISWVAWRQVLKQQSVIKHLVRTTISLFPQSYYILPHFMYTHHCAHDQTRQFEGNSCLPQKQFKQNFQQFEGAKEEEQQNPSTPTASSLL